MKTNPLQATGLKPIGYKTPPANVKIDKSKPHAWFRFEVDGYFEPAVLAEEMTITNLTVDIPYHKPLVIVVQPDKGNVVALVGYSCTSMFGDQGCRTFRFRSHFNNQKFAIPEKNIQQVYLPIGWMMDNRDVEPVVVPITV